MLDLEDVCTSSRPDLLHIVDLLTVEQKTCILNLSDEWRDSGYSRVMADLLWATSNRFFPDRFDPLVERRQMRYGRDGSAHSHRLLPLGMEIKRYLEHAAETF